MQEIWKAIERVVLLGTQRAQLPEKLNQQIKQFPIKLSDAGAESSLQTLSFFHYLKKGALNLPQLDELPGVAPPETMEAAPPKLRLLLNKMFGQEIYGPVIEEYLKLTNEHGILLAPESLYYLFEHYKNDLDAIAQIQDLMGNAGLWLCQQNLDWAIFMPLSNDSLWELGTAEDRRQSLLQKRRNDPAAAKEMLLQVWESEPWRNQLLFLSTLLVESNEEDVPFLQTCLRSKSKDIRQLVGKILCTIPAAGHNERIASLLQLLLDANAEYLSFDFEKNQDIIKELSQELGFHSSHTRPDKQKTTLEICLYFASQMAPSQWEQILQSNAQQAYEYLRESAYFSRLKTALAQSIHLHQDIQWMPLLLNPFLDMDRSHWDHEAIRRLAANLPFVVFDKMTRQYTSFHKNILEGGSLMYFILTQNKHQWPHQLSLNLIQIFQDYLMYSRNYFGDDAEHYEALLEVIALRTDPLLSARLQIGWPHGSFSWYKWEPHVQKMLRILHFRSALHKAFEPEKV